MEALIEDVLREYDGLIAREREDTLAGNAGEDRDSRFLAVGPQTGQLINILAKSLDRPVILEIGTSKGYSGIWLAEAARASGGRVITMELSEDKSAFARRMMQKAGLAEYVDFRVGDAVQLIDQLETRVDFVLLDLWKHLYVPCLQAFYPRLNPGAIIVADNIRPDREHVMDYVQKVREKPGVTSVTLPVGGGIELSRFQWKRLGAPVQQASSRH